MAFLDADDFFLPGKLAAQVKTFEAALVHDANLGIVHSGWVRVDPQGKPLMEVRPWETTPDLTLENWLKYKPVLPSAMLFRKDWLDHVGGFDPILSAAEDVDLAVRLALAGCSACWLKDVTTGYRQHGESAMGQGIAQAIALAKVLDTTFSHNQLTKANHLMEYQIRYGTLVWLAWYLYHTKQPQDMADYLQQSCLYSPHCHSAQLINWIESFDQFSTSWGYSLDVKALTESPDWQKLAQFVLAPINS